VDAASLDMGPCYLSGGLMIQHGRAAALEWRLQRCGGEWAAVSVRYVVSRRALDGENVVWAGSGYYLHRAGRWSLLGRYISGADARVQEVEDEGAVKPPPPSPAEVFGVVLQVAAAVLGFARKVSKKGR